VDGEMVLKSWFSNPSVHQDHLRSLLKCRSLGPNLTELSRPGGQETSSVSCLPCHSDADLNAPELRQNFWDKGVRSHRGQQVRWRQPVFGIQSGDGRWDKSTPSFGKRDLKDEPLQMPMIRATAGWPCHVPPLALASSYSSSLGLSPFFLLSVPSCPGWWKWSQTWKQKPS